ncbi:hypothetical protein SAMN05216559_3305 [Halomicrobium zhouii]|uniref:Uncharacterized protein n=1 Tax=Halomicrobium zhouii TaxID=767519 RepID=A0A1I6LWR8_9EURY|nr:hypothetical protein [Halomicrobium zhouii]SFS07848.1 hypothetical protein SAMN05216559_3305 [Halomicrobium zhouii]
MAGAEISELLINVVLPACLVSSVLGAVTVVYQRTMRFDDPTPLAAALLALCGKSSHEDRWKLRLAAEWGAFSATTSVALVLIVVTETNLFDGMIPLVLIGGQLLAAVVRFQSRTTDPSTFPWRSLAGQTVVLYLSWQFLWAGLWAVTLPIHGSGLVHAVPTPGRLSILLVLPAGGLYLVTGFLAVGMVVNRSAELLRFPNEVLAATASIAAIAAYGLLGTGLVPYPASTAVDDWFAIALVVALLAIGRVVVSGGHQSKDESSASDPIRR